jgi:hypothetical protein
MSRNNHEGHSEAPLILGFAGFNFALIATATALLFAPEAIGGFLYVLLVAFLDEFTAAFIMMTWNDKYASAILGAFGSFLLGAGLFWVNGVFTAVPSAVGSMFGPPGLGFQIYNNALLPLIVYMGYSAVKHRDWIIVTAFVPLFIVVLALGTYAGGVEWMRYPFEIFAYVTAIALSARNVQILGRN